MYNNRKQMSCCSGEWVEGYMEELPRDRIALEECDSYVLYLDVIMGP